MLGLEVQRFIGYTISCSFRAAGLAFRPLTTGNKDRRLHYQEISEWFVKSSSVTRTNTSTKLPRDSDHAHPIVSSHAKPTAKCNVKLIA